MLIQTKNLPIIILAMGLSPIASASDELFNEQLVRIINQLNAIKPLINDAQSYQSPSPVKLHLKAFIGADNRRHNGVSEDVELIKQGLIAYLNKPMAAPKKVSPIAGDFIASPKKGIG